MIERHESRTPRAVILAAGTGSRLVAQEAFPKPLKTVSGVPLIVRVLRTLQGEGIREAVIVIGYRGDQIRKALLAEPSLGMKLHFVQNERFERKNGVSLLAAKKYVDAALADMQKKDTLWKIFGSVVTNQTARNAFAKNMPRPGQNIFITNENTLAMCP